jgi:cobalamin biosynthesis Mg chelatase CobN
MLPGDVVLTPSGQPAVIVVRSARGWTVLAAGAQGWVDASARGQEGVEELTLVEAMSLADLVAAELGVTPEPDRAARRAARTSTPEEGPADTDPRDEEIAGLRRTVGQLEHALAARVSIERAIGVLAERHGTTPREAFEDLRRRARSQGRPAHELATEVLEGLPGRPPVPGPRGVPAPGLDVLPAPEPRPAGGGTTARRVQRSSRLVDGDGPVPGARR